MSDSDRGLRPSVRAWRRFRSHRPAVVGLVLFAALAALVVTAPAVLKHAPDAISEAQFAPPSVTRA